MFKPVRKRTIVTAIGASLMLPLGMANAQATPADIEALQAQMEALQAQIDELKSQQQTTQKDVATVSDNVVTKAPGGGLKIGETTLKIGGYVKAQATFADNGYGDGKASEIVTPSSLRTETNEDEGVRNSFSARQSRINVGTSTPVAGDTLNTFIEVDFYGADDEANEFVSNSYAPRLRHAYGSWGNWLAGQTWSTFMDLNGLGEVDAFGQQASVVFVRQTQLRYTQPFDGGSLQFALENPEDGGDDQSVPDIVGRVNFDGDWGHASVAALARRLTVDDGVDDDSEWGDAYSVTGRFPTFGKDDIRLQANYGNLGRYMGLRPYPDSQTDNGEIEGVDAWGASAIYRHYWTDNLRSSLAYSRTGLDEDGTGNMTDSYDTTFVNLMWSPMAQTTYGIEYQRFDLEEVDGDSFDLDRVHFSAQYTF
ncbi:Porin subfamily protein [Modicisalibacter ilicicola DSM 19980]|uniref:Porin subfamily protein n=1 Tax=Modicisalibacter ilicicola DSM 19980 TaxID=1121942 RepID=A0A1M5F8L0_9GAMM|nr:DcaP family trimeric outer membrane transporter [Halomonas ilicicola]SHF87923.1 Porin subfamily protein [Halomonas ilicicola DSM 19980]